MLRDLFCYMVALSIVLLGLSVPTMLLWNWLCPEIFGLKPIRLTQAAGLILLHSCLFRRLPIVRTLLNLLRPGS